MTQSEIAQITAAVIAALGDAKPASKAKKQTRKAPKTDTVDAKTDYRLRRNASVARGFGKRGIKLTFNAETGRFENVKPYKVWLSEGFQVRKGEKSVHGFFHVSQCDRVNPPVMPTDLLALKVGDTLPTEAPLGA